MSNLIIHCDSTRYVWEVLEHEEYSFLFKDLIVFDAGCNIGTFSLWIYPHAKRIYAVDCEQSYLDLFTQTIKDNDLRNITLYKEKLLNLNEFLSGNSIPVIDVLKLDVEGDEIPILQNDFPKDRVRTIIGEYHDRPVADLLTNLGYRYTEYKHRHFTARI